MSNEPGFIPPHGNYEELLSYRKAEVIYDITFRFCQRFLTRGDRTIDQMSRRRGRENKISSRAARLPGRRRKVRSN